MSIRMRIGLDCRLSGPHHAGIGRYIQNVMTLLPSAWPEATWVYFVAEPEQAKGLAAANVEIVVAPIRHYTVAEQLKMPGIFKRAKLDLLHVPHFNIPLWYRGKLVVTIHDLLWHEYRGSRVTTLNPITYWFKYFAYRWVATAAINRALRILVPAQTIKRTLARYYPKAEKKIEVTKEGVAQDFKPLNSKTNLTPTLTKLHLPKSKKCLLYVGSLYPHKNIGLVINALKSLPEYHLIIVGARNIFQRQTQQTIQAAGVTSQVTFTGYISDQELRILMSHCTALVQPSLSEGFGLTGVEAMGSGLPVLASQIPIFQEIYGKAALFFNPHSVKSFTQTLASLNPHTQAQLGKAAAKQIKEYQWSKTVSQTVEVYREALRKR